MDQTSKLAEEQKKFSNLNNNFEDLKKDNDAKKREAEDLKSQLNEERKVLAMIRSKSSMQNANVKNIILMIQKSNKPPISKEESKEEQQNDLPQNLVILTDLVK